MRLRMLERLCLGPEDVVEEGAFFGAPAGHQNN